MKTLIASFAGLVLAGMPIISNTVVADDLILSPSQPVVQRVVHYGAPVVAPAVVPTTTYYAPAPTTTYYAPAPTTTYYAPAASTIVPSAAPVTTYYAPSYVAPSYVAPVPTVVVPRTSYYAPATVVPTTVLPRTAYYAPTTAYYAPAATTAYYAPAVAAPVVVGSPAVIRSKVYYPGEPVRNFFKAITP